MRRLQGCYSESLEALPPFFCHAYNGALRLVASEVRPGGALPARKQLAERLQASRTTVTRILERMQEQGVIGKSGSALILQRPPTQEDFLPEPATLTRSQAVEESLMRMLSSGELKPGQRFSELAIAQRHGVTTGTVREAMASLARLGIFRKPQRRQWQVVELTAGMLDELMDLRELLECHGLARHFETPGRAEREATFRDLLEQTSAWRTLEQIDPGVFLDLDARLHRTILEAARNRYLMQHFEFASFPIQWQFAHHGFGQDLLRLGARQHEEILEAVLSGHAKSAVERLHKHLRTARQTLHTLLESEANAPS